MSERSYSFAVTKARGRLRVMALEHFKWLERSIGEGEAWTMTLEPVKAKRSSQQNRYYFGVVIKMMSDHCGYEPDEMHEVLAMKFLRIEDDPITGSPRRRRTPKTSTKEFAEYVDQCIRFAATELGIVIPDAEHANVA